jgi:hypothetical protein
VNRFFPLPDAGDIIWCRFPYRGFSVPGPKARPALVVDLGRLRDEPAVEVIFGTSRKVDHLYPGEFLIAPDDGTAFAASGLSFSTKFDFTRSVYLPYHDQWFAVPPGAPCGQIPKLGVLHPSLMRRAKAAFDAASAP